MDITGTIKVIGQTQQVSDKFKKRDFVITENSSQYPQHISMQLTQDKCHLLDNYNPGDEIKCHFNLRGREWTSPQGETKYFNQIECWKVEGQKWSKPVENSPSSNQSPGDDLPF